MNIILRVTELSVKKQYAEEEVKVEPVGDMLYELDVPSTGLNVKEGEITTLNDVGMRHIMKGLKAILYQDMDREDF